MTPCLFQTGGLSVAQSQSTEKDEMRVTAPLVVTALLVERMVSCLRLVASARLPRGLLESEYRRKEVTETAIRSPSYQHLGCRSAQKEKEIKTVASKNTVQRPSEWPLAEQLLDRKQRGTWFCSEGMMETSLERPMAVESQ